MRKIVNIPKQHVSDTVKLRNLAENYDQLGQQYERQRRLLWMAVHAAGGRVEIGEDVYEATTRAPHTDTFVKVEHDKPGKKIVLVFCDEHGERLPESEPKLIVTP